MKRGDEVVGVRGTLRAFFALERDVVVLSVAMFAFSLGFQMTSRYIPEYMAVLGASSVVIGLYGTIGNVISAVYPYPGGLFSDRVGSRFALTVFGFVSSLGFFIWFVAPVIGSVTLGSVVVAPWVWIFVGLVFAQAWKSFGLGATFAIVKQSVPVSRLAAGFASTETFRRLAFLVGPLLAAGVLLVVSDFTRGFQYILGVTVVIGLGATITQHVLYDATGDTMGKAFTGVSTIVQDLRELPRDRRSLLIGDTLVRFANGMVYVFFVIVIVRYLRVDATVFGVYLAPAVYFGVLLAIEMLVALVTMAPAARLAEHIGLKPVVAGGFFVYAVFPVVLISAPANAVIVGLLFAFSGLRFAGLPAHKALIVGPAEVNTGGRVSGSYYLVRNTIVIPSAAIGGWLYSIDPVIAFGAASILGVSGTLYFMVRGEEFAPYAPGT